MFNRKKSWLDCLRLPVTLAYMASILGMSSIPGVIPDDASGLQGFFGWVAPSIQNLMHIPVYAGLAVLWCWTLELCLTRFWRTAGACLIAICFGVLDEWFQSFIPGRYASVNDILANALGAGVGVCAYSYLWVGTRRKSNRNNE